MQILIIWYYCMGLRSKKVDIPDANQPQDDRKVIFEISGSKMLVHIVATR